MPSLTKYLRTPQVHRVSMVLTNIIRVLTTPLLYVLIPKWAQTPYGNRESPNGNFLAASPFPYGESPYENGD
jgi:hypothetical protein